MQYSFCPFNFIQRKVDERLRAVLNCHPVKEMKEGDKNFIIWGTFMTSSLQALIFLGKS